MKYNLIYTLLQNLVKQFGVLMTIGAKQIWSQTSNSHKT